MTVKIDIHSSRIRIDSSRPLKGLQKKIPGANFARTGGPHWTAPLNMDTCRILREVFREELEVGPELLAWATAKRDREKTLRKLGKSSTAVLQGKWRNEYPDLWRAVTEARPYQSAGVKYICSGRKVIVADGVGLGKTVQTLAAVPESGITGPILVVCPKTPVWSVWSPEIQRWLPDYGIYAAPDGRSKRNRILDEFLSGDTDYTFVVVNQEMLRTKSYWVCRNRVDDEKCGERTIVKSGKKELSCGHDPKKGFRVDEHEYPQLFQVEWAMIVADESDKCLLKKNRISTQTRRGMEMLKLQENGIKIAQSATPWRSRPHLLWSTLNWLFEHEYGSFWAWVQSLYDVEEDFDGTRRIGKLRRERERILYRVLNSIMIRRTKQEVAGHLPRKLYIGQPLQPKDPNSLLGVWLPMEDDQLRAYREMESDATAVIMGGEIDAIGSLAELTRLAQFATSYGKITDDGFKPALPSNKFDYLVDMLGELGFPDDPQSKVIVVSRFTSVLELFASELKKKHKIESVMLTGKVTGEKRASVIGVFNDPKSRPHLMFMNTKAGGSAITLDGADEMVFIDETYVADDQEQCEGRIDNRRPEEKIVQRRYRYLRSIDTIEVGIGYVNQASSSEDRRLLDERRGVAYAIDVLNKTMESRNEA